MLAAQHARTGDMVNMFVGDEDGGEIVRRQAQLGKGLLDAAGGDARVHQQVDAAGRDQQTVALGATGQCIQ